MQCLLSLDEECVCLAEGTWLQSSQIQDLGAFRVLDLVRGGFVSSVQAVLKLTRFDTRVLCLYDFFRASVDWQ